MATNRRAFLVFGPERTGTKFVTALLIAGGCAGEAVHHQAFDVENFPNEGPIVFRRSFPHGHLFKWPDIGAIKRRLVRAGRKEIFAVVTVRDAYATKASQVRTRRVTHLAQAERRIQWAYTRIFHGLHQHQINCAVVTYESLVGNPAAVHCLLDRLGLTFSWDRFPRDVVVNGNYRYYLDAEK